MQNILNYYLPASPFENHALLLTKGLVYPLTVQLHDSQPVLYTLEDESFPQTTLTLSCYMTGQNIPQSIQSQIYLGTVQLPGPFVLHYFMQ